MCKLIKKADILLETSEEALEKFRVRDQSLQLEAAAFNLQQCMEFYIKGFVNLLGERYKYGHELTPNIEIIKSLYIEDNTLRLYYDNMTEALNKIELYDNMYTEWEARSRYYHKFVVSEEEIVNAIELCKILQENIWKFVSEYER